MRKTTIMLVTVLFMIIGYAAYNATVNIYGLGKISENISDFKVYLDNLKVNDIESTGINDAKDEFTLSNIDGNISIDIVNDSTEYDTESYLECVKNNTWDFDYTGSEQTFTAPVSGTYKLETWGAQGGDSLKNVGGYGGYSVGTTKLNKDDVLYVNVGGAGKQVTNGTDNGGYNGGGAVYVVNVCSNTFGSGGGATHIANTSGQLSTLSKSLDKILIVSSGGAGASYRYCSASDVMYGDGGSGGGIIGSSPKMYSTWETLIAIGGSQTSGGTGGTTNKESGTTNGAFGKGGSYSRTGGYTGQAGGGGGLYGGGLGLFASGAGGSGYIGNSQLSEKSMYCYNCTESSEESTKTISTTCTSATPTANCAKSGNGYVRITLVSSDEIEKISTEVVTIEAQDKKKVTLENINTGSLTCKLKVNKLSRTTKEEKYIGSTEWAFDYTGGRQVFTAPMSGSYKIELWGASGGDAINAFGGYGAYVSGEIDLDKKTNLYIYVGGQGKASTSGKSEFVSGGFNGGGYTNGQDCCSRSFGTGGGATDVRIKDGAWDNDASLSSRIMVAGGGGGSFDGINYTHLVLNGGSGGTLNGNAGVQSSNAKDQYCNGLGGTQTSGGAINSTGTYCTSQYVSQTGGGTITGAFGKGGSNTTYNTMSSGGGGGYYGGSSSGHIASGGGGSSYISGYLGCVAITSESNRSPRKDSKANKCADGTSDITCSYHYSGYIFTNTTMISGRKTMPTHDGTNTAVGNNGNGYAKVTLLN